MASAAGTLEILARELALALSPLEQRLASGRADQLFVELGLRLPAGLSADPQLAAAISAGATAAAALGPLAAQLTAAIEDEDPIQIISVGAQLIAQSRTVIQAIDALAAGIDAAAGGLSPQDRADVAAFAALLPRRLLDFLLVEYLAARAPLALPGLTLLGLVDRAPELGDAANPLKPPFIRRAVHFERLPDLVSDPATYLADTYGWGTPAFDGLALFQNVSRFLEALDFPVDLLTPPGQPAILEAYLFTFRVNPATTPPGLVANLRFPATQDFERSYPLSPPWGLAVSAKARFVADIDATVTPPLDVSVRPPREEVHVDVTAGVKGEDTANAIVLLGQAGGTRLEATTISAELGISTSWSGGDGRARGEPLVRAEVKGGKLVIDMSQGDGFIQSILSGIKVNSAFQLAASWRPSTGLELEGGAGIELVIPVHVSLGPVEIQTLYLLLAFGDDEPVRLETTVAIAAAIGPLTVSVDRIGAAGIFRFPPDRQGNLGPVDLAFAFKPPTGIGVLVKAGPIGGGGFLSFEEEAGRYAGMLQLEALGVSVTAIGLLDTRLPGVTSGYSFLIIVSVTFPPIQLGYGFTLNGVGGLAGIHRLVLTEVLRQGIRNGALNGIMFPVDPIRNAPQIISDLRAVFPPALNRFVFGPFLKLGWGVPTLITANLGVVLELPDPVRILILGQVKVALPAPELPVVSLNLDVLGIIDFEQQLFSIDASLYDSRVGPFSVYGDMALRLSWGAPPILALAIGGLHPQFRPPPGFPQLRRATIEIGLGDNPRLTCQSYLALTSNSLQNGSRIELYAAAAGFNIHGWLGYDAIIIFIPLSFLVDIDGGVELRRGTRVIAGIHVDAHLTGPGEWHAWGRACLSLLFFDICVPFSVTIGNPLEQILARVNPWALLEAALRNPQSWESALPGVAFRAVGFALPEGATVTLVDPVGVLRGHQKVLPLNRKLAKLGEAAIDGADHFDVSRVAIGTSTVAHESVSDFFAAGQYQELTDAEKLSRDSYEPMDAGVTVGTAGATSGFTRAVPVEYETIVIDAPEGPEAPFRDFVSRRLGVHALALGSLVARAARVYGTHLTATGREGSLAVAPQLRFEDDDYVIVGTRDLARSDLVAAATTKGRASDALAAHLAAHPEERGRWQVVPLHELEGVA
jgi:uncharacterized protein DUF6603